MPQGPDCESYTRLFRLARTGATTGETKRDSGAKQIVLFEFNKEKVAEILAKAQEKGTTYYSTVDAVRDDIDRLLEIHAIRIHDVNARGVATFEFSGVNPCR